MHTTEEFRLRKDLQAAGFMIVTLDGTGLNDESDLLRNLGLTLKFPGYYGANWDAFADCVGEMACHRDRIALIWNGADVLLRRDLHGFVRSIHELLSVARDLSSLKDPFQMEFFLVGDLEVFRNAPAPRPTSGSS